jgi:CRP-like cAMP-binding protein
MIRQGCKTATYHFCCDHFNGDAGGCKSFALSLLDLQEEKAVEEGSLFGEIAFFTENAATETVSTVTVCRIMALPRATWRRIMQNHALGARMMLKNLFTSSCVISGDSRNPENIIQSARESAMLRVGRRGLSALRMIIKRKNLGGRGGG